MKRINVRAQQLSTLPAGAYLEIFQDGTNFQNSKSQYMLASDVVGAPVSGQLTSTVPTGTTQALSGTGALGAVNLTSFLTTVSTTGAATATLAAGTTKGLTKRIRMIADVGDCVITVSGTGISSITLNDVNDQIDLIWDGAGWVELDNQGCVVA